MDLNTSINIGTEYANTLLDAIDKALAGDNTEIQSLFSKAVGPTITMDVDAGIPEGIIVRDLESGGLYVNVEGFVTTFDPILHPIHALALAEMWDMTRYTYDDTMAVMGVGFIPNEDGSDGGAPRLAAIIPFDPDAPDPGQEEVLSVSLCIITLALILGDEAAGE